MTPFAQLLSDIQHATAYPMTPPESYGTFHLTFAIVGFILCVTAAWFLRNISQKKARILLVCVGALLLLFETYKQLFYCFCIDEVGYKWWIFPFQMCSVPMYLCIIAPLLKPGRLSRGMYSFMMIYNLLGGFITFFEPSGINLGYWGLTLHAYCWHMILVFIGLFLCFSGMGGRTMKDYWSASYTFVALCVIAFGINVLVGKVTGNSINMFFVGPQNSSLIVFEDIAANYGWYVSTLIYIPAVCLGAFLFFIPIRLYGKHQEKKLAAVS